MKLKLPLGIKILIALSASVTLVLFCGFANNPAQKSAAIQNKIDSRILFVSAPVYLPLAALKGEERFPQGAQIFSLEPGEAKPVQFISEFFATADPSVSFDARTILFSGKKLPTDSWRIYEFSLTTREVHPIFAASDAADGVDQIHPLYLPHDRLVYAQRTVRGFRIEAAQLDGTDIQPLTFIPASAIPADVLADGRILFESYFPLGTGNAPELFLVYSDGSGVESYRCDHPGSKADRNSEHDASPAAGRWGGHQNSSGDVLFTHGESLARFTSPLATEAPLAAPQLTYSGGPIELDGGSWIISAHSAVQKHFSLSLYSNATHTTRTVFADATQDLVEPVLLAARKRPNHHPSGLHDWQYGNFLALDSRLTRDAPLAAQPASVRLEELDAHGKLVTLGDAPVETDGSFFIQTTGDTSVRFSLLDTDGKVLRSERGFIWIKKGEQRICVGCHTGPERASENKVPAVLLRTTTPADLNFKTDALKEDSAAAGEK